MRRKKCFKCGQTKTLTRFYTHPRMADGHLNKCAVCTRRDVQENYVRRRDAYLAYERSRSGQPHRLALLRSQKMKHPEHWKARIAVHNAVRRGKLKRLPCEVCGVAKVEAHHEDYSRALVVVWLCRKHHKERHRMERRDVA